MNKLNSETTSPQPHFAGFAPPTSNYFHMPNEWTDITAEIDSLAELKVVEYVLRHTWGFHEFGICKVISIDEFMQGRKRADGSRMDKGTKLSRPSVIDGLKRAIVHGYLICAVDESDQARIKKAYALNMRKDEKQPSTKPPHVKLLNTRGKESLPPTQSRIFTPEVKHVDPRGKDVLPRSEKETSERHSQKERETKPTTPSNRSDDSLSLSSDDSLLSQLTDEQIDFWRRWCVLKKCSDKDLTAKSSAYVVELAPKIKTTEEIHSIYDLAYDGLKEYAASQGRTANPPELYNLVKVLPKWAEAQAKKRQDSEQERKASEHLPGTGRMVNLTEARLRGEAPPIRYDAPSSPVAQRIKSGNISAENLPAWLRKKLKDKAPDETVPV